MADMWTTKMILLTNYTWRKLLEAFNRYGVPSMKVLVLRENPIEEPDHG